MRRLRPRRTSYKNSSPRTRLLLDLKSKQKFCTLCWEIVEPYSRLIFHHIYPNDKLFDLSSPPRGISNTAFLSELEKCILICPKCHKLYHSHKE